MALGPESKGMQRNLFTWALCRSVAMIAVIALVGLIRVKAKTESIALPRDSDLASMNHTVPPPLFSFVPVVIDLGQRFLEHHRLIPETVDKCLVWILDLWPEA